ncbi:MAG: flavin reductase family protein [Proteobacteria bacterium]|nr:flavin reductase family protein [Pseudomonadota bacterium]
MASDNDKLRTAFIHGMARCGSGVSVVTTAGRGGTHGVTVSAMTSLSADMPRPTLLVCIHHKTPAATAIKKNGVFAVNLLKSSQSALSDMFAGRTHTHATSHAKFAEATWREAVTGSPMLAECLVAFDCTLYQRTRVGTHYVFIGAVEAIDNPNEGDPLVYAQRSYGRFEKTS